MKLGGGERLRLYQAVLVAIVSREKWPEFPPPAKDGSPAKKTSMAFALACHAEAITRAAIWILEKDGQRPEPDGDDSGDYR